MQFDNMVELAVFVEEVEELLGSDGKKHRSSVLPVGTSAFTHEVCTRKSGP